MEQTLILVDERDRPRGYAARGACHAGDGLLHRAIVVLLYNRHGQILLQRRKAALWDDHWDVTGATHPLHLAGGDESYVEAGRRCLAAEWNVAAPLSVVSAFTYFARHGAACENEYCAVLAGQYDGPLGLSDTFGYGLRWLDAEACRDEMVAGREPYTPWARLTLDRVLDDPSLAARLRRASAAD